MVHLYYDPEERPGIFPEDVHFLDLGFEVIEMSFRWRLVNVNTINVLKRFIGEEMECLNIPST